MSRLQRGGAGSLALALALLFPLWVIDCLLPVPVETASAEASTPLASLLFTPLLPLTQRMTACVLILLTAFLGRWLLVRYSAWGQHTYLLVLLASMWGTLLPVPPDVQLSAACALTCLVFALPTLLNTAQPALLSSAVFRASALLGICPLIYQPAWPLGLIPLVALFYRGALRADRVLLMLIGYALPAVAAWLTCYLLGRPSEWLLPNPASWSWQPVLWWDFVQRHVPIMLFWALLLVLWIAHLLQARKPHSARIGAYLLTRGLLRAAVLLACLGAATSHYPGVSQGLVALPLAAGLSQFFVEGAQSRPRRILFYAILTVTLGLAYAGRFVSL